MESKRTTFSTRLLNTQLELTVWATIACLVGLRVLKLAVNGYVGYIFEEHYFELLTMIVIVLFPFLFKLIYSEFPLEFLRNRRSNTSELVKMKENLKPIIVSQHVPGNVKENSDSGNEFFILNHHLELSKTISQQIYSRSNAYLLIGCLIAFAGVIFFYFQSLSIHIAIDHSTSEFVSTLREYFPRIGTLIFVESIAFFFLRQYKSTMEEFRYYEAIKRQRENQLLTAKLSQQHIDNPDYFIKLIEAMRLNENPNKLSSNETTQILETQKISGPETDVIEKLMDLLKILKK